MRARPHLTWSVVSLLLECAPFRGALMLAAQRTPSGQHGEVMRVFDKALPPLAALAIAAPEERSKKGPGVDGHRVALPFVLVDDELEAKRRREVVPSQQLPWPR